MTVEEREQRWAEAMRAERRGEALAYQRMLKKLRLPCVGRLRWLRARECSAQRSLGASRQDLRFTGISGCRHKRADDAYE
jgi:hypothetical protein